MKRQGYVACLFEAQGYLSSSIDLACVVIAVYVLVPSIFVGEHDFRRKLINIFSTRFSSDTSRSRSSSRQQQSSNQQQTSKQQQSSKQQQITKQAAAAADNQAAQAAAATYVIEFRGNILKIAIILYVPYSLRVYLVEKNKVLRLSCC